MRSPPPRSTPALAQSPTPRGRAAGAQSTEGRSSAGGRARGSAFARQPHDRAPHAYAIARHAAPVTWTSRCAAASRPARAHKRASASAATRRRASGAAANTGRSTCSAPGRKAVPRPGSSNSRGTASWTALENPPRDDAETGTRHRHRSVGDTQEPRRHFLHARRQADPDTESHAGEDCPPPANHQPEREGDRCRHRIDHAQPGCTRRRPVSSPCR